MFMYNSNQDWQTKTIKTKRGRKMDVLALELPTEAPEFAEIDKVLVS